MSAKRNRIMMDMALALSGLGTCNRLKVGCIIMGMDKTIVGGGYNGSPSGADHCDKPGIGCLMHNGHCVRCTHGELNAILRTSDRKRLVGATAYITHSPCINCVREMKAVGIATVYFDTAYHWDETKALIDEAGEGFAPHIEQLPRSFKKKYGMTFDDYLEGVLKTMQVHEDKTKAKVNWAMGIGGEVGEVIELIKKDVFQGRGLCRESLQKELGDVLWYITALATTCGIDLEGVAVRNLDKLKNRFPDGWEPGGGRR